MSYDFQIFCSISIRPRRHRILFTSKPNFRLLPNKIDTVKNIAKKTANNSELTPSKNKKDYVKFNDQWCNKFKFIQKGVAFALCTVCGSGFSIVRGGENDINRYRVTLMNKGHMDAAQQQRKLIDLGDWLTGYKLKPKSCERRTAFFQFPG